MADNKPTLHAMDNSQSQRIIWLLEELGVEYNVIHHQRNPPSDPIAPFRSPESIKAIGPYGKAPILITGSADGNRYIPESDAICTYLIHTFDKEDKCGLRTGDRIRDEILNSFNLTELTRSVLAILFIDFGIIRNGEGPGGMWYDGVEMRILLGQLERELKDGPKGGYFMGENPGRADIMMEYPVSFIKHRNWVDLKEEFPLLDAWLMRVYDRPAWKRALKRGNGYNLNVFPRIPR